jgi:hypothetical protein
MLALVHIQRFNNKYRLAFMKLAFGLPRKSPGNSLITLAKSPGFPLLISSSTIHFTTFILA